MTIAENIQQTHDRVILALGLVENIDLRMALVVG